MGTPSVDVTVEPITIEGVTVDLNVEGLDNIGATVGATVGIGGTGTDLGAKATVGGTGTPVGLQFGGSGSPIGLGATVGGTGTPVGLQVGGSGTPIDVGATIGGTSTPVGVDLTAEAAIGGTSTPIGFDADLTARLKELAPLFFNFLWKEIPLVKVALPHRYKLGFKFFNVEFFSISFCGESELITDKNLCDHDHDHDHDPGGKHV
jgi:hypothetical protein